MEGSRLFLLLRTPGRYLMVHSRIVAADCHVCAESNGQEPLPQSADSLPAIFRGIHPGTFASSRTARCPPALRSALQKRIVNDCHNLLAFVSLFTVTMGSIAQRSAVFMVDPYHPAAIAKLQSNHDIDLVLPGDPRRNEYLRDATGVLVRSETRIGEEELEKASDNLKYIIKQGVGVDNIDLEAAKRRGIKVFNTPALNSEAVAELTITLALCIARRVGEVDRLIRNGEKVVRSKVLGKSLFQKTLGVIGMGNIGLEVAKKWRGAMGGCVIAFDPYAKDDAWSNDFLAESFKRVHQLEELLQGSDVITLHVPLTNSTKDLLSTPQFAMMREGATLLNCARGGVVDEAALLEALNSGRVFGAGLDAMNHEPPTLKDYGETLLKHPRVLMSPHIGASTEENQANSGLKAVEIMFDLLEGGSAAEKHRPLN